MRRGPTRRLTLQHKRRSEVNNRVEWYYREYGRPPTIDELVAIREYNEDVNPRYYPPKR